MELALNLGWLSLTCLLLAGCGWAHCCGQLRLPLRVALGCSLLLAVLLFPAISMSDDLQRANLEVEGRVRDLALLDAVNLSEPLQSLPVLLLAMLFVGALALMRLRWLGSPRKLWMRTLASHAPSVVARPPTVAFSSAL